MTVWSHTKKIITVNSAFTRSISGSKISLYCSFLFECSFCLQQQEVKDIKRKRWIRHKIEHIFLHTSVLYSIKLQLEP